ncbi:MAG TPA: hypothetical protein VHV10_10280 [Ktedonobacteraceae bacterium]|nr:hypothetical protein [Ktedonobacteraceae bacterium]
MESLTCQCSACSRFFESIEAFDAHRTGSYDPPRRRCLAKSEMLRSGLSPSSDGTWSATAPPVARPGLRIQRDRRDLVAAGR